MLRNEFIHQSPDINLAVIQTLQQEAFQQNNLTVSVLRLDSIHPVISGNKWFKLQYFLQQAKTNHNRGILTFGGAWSNHLVATALAAKQAALACTGIIRGEQPANLSAALQDAVSFGMQLQFVSRTDYAHANHAMQKLQQLHPDYLVIPQGGQSEWGVKGAAAIMGFVPAQTYSHIIAAVGTGTMLAGLVQASDATQQVMGVSSLKINAAGNSIENFIREQTIKNNCTILYDYHFGGYARHTPELLQFMNTFYRQHHIPTDFVYTGKLFFALNDLIEKRYFPAGSRILVIHSGGLQGNRSLPTGSLHYQ